MKITDVKLRFAKHYLFVQVYTDAGIVGLGEAGNWGYLQATAAAIENKADLDTWSYQCTGSLTVGADKITCPKVHGTMDIYGALANSCNCAYATLAMELGGDVLAEYADSLQLTKSYDIDGIKAAAGTFNFDSADVNIGWAGIGQFEDQLNPLSMMVYMGAIAGEGRAALPVLLSDESLIKKGAELIRSDSAAGAAARRNTPRRRPVPVSSSRKTAISSPPPM